MDAGVRGTPYTRKCDYLTFIGEPTADATVPGGVMNPTLDNTYELTGALVSTFDTETETYRDTRMFNGTGNPHSQVQSMLRGCLHELACHACNETLFADCHVHMTTCVTSD